MLSRLGKTLSTNVAIGGLALLVLGAGGASATLAAGSTPTPDSHANTHATEHSTDAEDSADDADENETDTDTDANDAEEGTRPTDTHGYCVSQVAQAETTSTDAGAHGAAVKAAAQSCPGTGSDATPGSQATAHRQNGTHGKPATTGRPATAGKPATAGAAAQR